MTKSVFTDAYATLQRALRAMRVRAHVSQVELARRLGKPQPFVSYLERGERRVDMVEFYAIAKALGADPVEAYAEVVRQFPDRVEI